MFSVKIIMIFDDVSQTQIVKMETKPCGVELSEAWEASGRVRTSQPLQGHLAGPSPWRAAVGLALRVTLGSSFLKVLLSFPDSLGPLSPQASQLTASPLTLDFAS